MILSCCGFDSLHGNQINQATLFGCFTIGAGFAAVFAFGFIATLRSVIAVRNVAALAAVPVTRGAAAQGFSALFAGRFRIVVAIVVVVIMVITRFAFAGGWTASARECVLDITGQAFRHVPATAAAAPDAGRASARLVDAAGMAVSAAALAA
jgi:hypothetical protein